MATTIHYTPTVFVKNGTSIISQTKDGKARILFKQGATDYPYDPMEQPLESNVYVAPYGAEGEENELVDATTCELFEANNGDLDKTAQALKEHWNADHVEAYKLTNSGERGNYPEDAPYIVFAGIVLADLDDEDMTVEKAVEYATDDVRLWWEQFNYEFYAVVVQLLNAEGEWETETIAPALGSAHAGGTVAGTEWAESIEDGEMGSYDWGDFVDLPEPVKL